MFAGYGSKRQFKRLGRPPARAKIKPPRAKIQISAAEEEEVDLEEGRKREPEAFQKPPQDFESEDEGEEEEGEDDSEPAAPVWRLPRGAVCLFLGLILGSLLLLFVPRGSMHHLVSHGYNLSQSLLDHPEPVDTAPSSSPIESPRGRADEPPAVVGAPYGGSAASVCVELCGDLFVHAVPAPCRALLPGAAVLPEPPFETDAFQCTAEAVREALIDTRPWRCLGASVLQSRAAAAGCACDSSGRPSNALASSASAQLLRRVARGSCQLRRFLRAYAANQAYMLALLDVKLGVEGAQARQAAAADRLTSLGLPRPARPRFIVVEYAAGGTADQAKAMMVAFLLSLLSEEPTGFMHSFNTFLPIAGTVWNPLASLVDAGAVADVGIDWRLRPGVSNQLTGLLSRGTIDTVVGATDVAWAINSSSPDIVASYGNIIFGRHYRPPSLDLNTVSRWYRSWQSGGGGETAPGWADAGTCEPELPPEAAAAAMEASDLWLLPPELRGIVTPVIFKGLQVVLREAAKAAAGGPRAVSQTTGGGGGGGGERAVAVVADDADSPGSCPAFVPAALPGVVASTPTSAAANLNLPFQLMDWLFAPSAAVVRRIGTLGQHYAGAHRDTQYVISVHVRTGVAPGAAWPDAPRDSVQTAPVVAMHCVAVAAEALVTRYGPRERVLVFVASDNPQPVFAAMTRIATGRGSGLPLRVAGMSVQVISFNAATTVHVAQSVKSGGAADAQDFVDVYAELQLLATAHAMVRSRSGFSELAQAMGRVPIVYRFSLEAGEADPCEDMSHSVMQSKLPPLGAAASDKDLYSFELPRSGNWLNV